MKGTQHTSFLLRSPMRQEPILPTAKHTIYSDGTSGWLASPQGNRAMSLQEMQQVQGETFRMLYHLLAISDANIVSDDTLEFIDGKSAAHLVVHPKTSLSLQLTHQAS